MILPGFGFVLNNLFSTLSTLTIISLYTSLTYFAVKYIQSTLKPRFNVKGKHAYITGGSQGLGRSIAIWLAKRGANVTVVARNKSLLDSVVSECKRVAPTQKFCRVVADVTSETASINALNEAVAGIGRVPDMVFTIAGSAEPGFLQDLDASVYEAQMKLNYLGTVYTVKEATRLMIEAGVKVELFNAGQSGALFLVGSVCRVLGDVSLYTDEMCDQGYFRDNEGLAEVLRQEMLMHEIEVHCLFPGSIKTAGFEKENKRKPALTREIEGDDAMTPEAVAEVSLKRVFKDEVFVVSEPLGELLMSASLGFLPKNNLVLHVACVCASLIVCPVLRLYTDHRTRQEKNKKRN